MNSSEQVAPGDKIHSYKPSHYNKRGVVLTVRESDPLGRVTVRMDQTGEEVLFHTADFEIRRATTAQ